MPFVLLGGPEECGGTSVGMVRYGVYKNGQHPGGHPILTFWNPLAHLVLQHQYKICRSICLTTTSALSRGFYSLVRGFGSRHHGKKYPRSVESVSRKHQFVPCAVWNNRQERAHGYRSVRGILNVVICRKTWVFCITMSVLSPLKCGSSPLSRLSQIGLSIYRDN
jgi:hypothetical protein